LRKDYFTHKDSELDLLKKNILSNGKIQSIDMSEIFNKTEAKLEFYLKKFASKL
jgi:hypothetical protein